MATLLGLTDDRKAEVVFDFVGSDETIATAPSVARPMGTFALVGVGAAPRPLRGGRVPLECEVFIPLGGSHPDLHEVVALAEQGLVRSEVETFTFDQTEVAYEHMRTGDVRGRVVVCPDR